MGGGFQFQLYHHHQQHPNPILMPPISFPFNLRSITTTTLCLLSSKCFSTTTTTTKRSKSPNNNNKLSSDELKQHWLNSLNPPPPTLLKPKQTLDHNHDDAWVIGIDPDVSGALAVLKTFHSSAQVYDSPNVKVLIGNRVRRRMDTKAMVQLLQTLSIPIGTTAYIEQSLPYPGDGKQGWWSGGFNYGLWIGVLVASGVSVVPVPSMRWKQEFKLSGNGKTKDDSRALACSLFPSLSSSLKRKKDHGRAEALLIAAYGKGIRLKSDSDSESLTTIDTDNTTL
ncbi:hypothetical protein QVD17_05331 [Tagetes erecta]|uniref:Holliday junction resolvase MOC1, chloroplastic n=1 Tax=Tagetes erecta TaxID=13708 RepID=A0AAD8LJJ1_TARER|nr:hypothetical protein QVD17_05331 [Tagetes erecta]